MSASDSDSDSEPFFTLPAEPATYRPLSPPSTTKPHTLTTSPHETLRIHLVGHDPLWGHYLWNSGVVMATFLEKNVEKYVKGKKILELGAGGGLPSLVCGMRGAETTVVTDYPAGPLIANLGRNVRDNNLEGKVHARGYLWGADADEVMEYAGEGKGGFDLVLLSDLMFNHSEHEKLADSVVRMLKKSPEARALVFFTPHRPWLYEKDLDFFRIAKERGFEVEECLKEMLEAPMFEEDRGDRDLRRTVFGFELRWSDDQLKN